MDTTRFDRITMAIAETPSRRDLLRLFGVAAAGASGLVLLGSDATDAKRGKKKRKNKKKGSKCKGKCGGSCPRCEAGTSCQDRDECTTGFCDGGVCTVPDDAGQCGLDTNSDTCFRRENKENGEFYCSRQACRFIGEASCNQCTGQEICSPAGGENIECCMPCGA